MGRPSREARRQGEPRQARRIDPAGVHGVAARADCLAIDVRRERPLARARAAPRRRASRSRPTLSNSVRSSRRSCAHALQDSHTGLPARGGRVRPCRGISALPRSPSADAVRTSRPGPTWPICGQACHQEARSSGSGPDSTWWPRRRELLHGLAGAAATCGIQRRGAEAFDVEDAHGGIRLTGPLARTWMPDRAGMTAGGAASDERSTSAGPRTRRTAVGRRPPCAPSGRCTSKSSSRPGSACSRGHGAERGLEADQAGVRARAGGSSRRHPARCASGAMPAATAATAPPLEPPGVSAGFQGLPVTPNSGLSV